MEADTRASKEKINAYAAYIMERFRVSDDKARMLAEKFLAEMDKRFGIVDKTPTQLKSEMDYMVWVWLYNIPNWSPGPLLQAYAEYIEDKFKISTEKARRLAAKFLSAMSSKGADVNSPTNARADADIVVQSWLESEAQEAARKKGFFERLWKKVLGF